jgi:hypothetical protein
MLAYVKLLYLRLGSITLGSVRVREILKTAS